MPWAKTSSACSRQFSWRGTASNPPSPQRAAKTPSSSTTSQASCSPSPSALPWSITTALPSPGWAEASIIWSPTKRNSFPPALTPPSCRTSLTQIADFEIRMDSPTWGDILGTIVYVVVIILLAACQAISIVVVAYGFIATAVCVLVGPIFVPFFIVPKLEWLFWGWFRCFLQYAFYQVIAAAVVFIISNLILGALRLPPAGALSTVQLIAWFPGLADYFRRRDLRPAQSSRPHKPHLQWHGRRLVRSATRGPCGSGRVRGEGAGMNRDASFEDAKRLYLESCGDPMVTNTYLKIALALVSLVCRGACAHRPAHHSHLQELPASGHPHRRSWAAPRPSTTTISSTNRRTPRPNISSREFTNALLPAQPLHHPKRFREVAVFPRR